MSDYNSEYFKKWFNMGMDASIPEYFSDKIKESERFDFNEWYTTHAPKVLGDHKINLPFKNESKNPDPQYETMGASGFDLRANINKTLRAGEYYVIPTGLSFQIPDGFEIQIRPRSGLAAKNGVTVLNSVGTIDADYRGEIKVILINHGDKDFVVNVGDRIAQGVIATVTAKNIINLTRVNTINEDTERGSNGFGSTGTN